VQAQNNVDETLLAIERMVTETRMAEAMARLAPLPRGSYKETPGPLQRVGGLVFGHGHSAAAAFLPEPRWAGAADQHLRADGAA
jgi:hypothetical protein